MFSLLTLDYFQYPHSNVRKASTTAGIRLCIVLHKMLKETDPNADIAPGEY